MSFISKHIYPTGQTTELREYTKRVKRYSDIIYKIKVKEKHILCFSPELINKQLFLKHALLISRGEKKPFQVGNRAVNWPITVHVLSKGKPLSLVMLVDWLASKIPFIDGQWVTLTDLPVL